MKHWIILAACLVPMTWYWYWDPSPGTDAFFDRGRNGLWLGEKWYSGESVVHEEADALIALLRQNSIRYAYVRSGTIENTGSLERTPGRLFFHLKDSAPDIVFLPWISGDGEQLPIEDPTWRLRVVQAIKSLNSSGVDGIHLNLEPIRDGHAAYIALLAEIRNALPGEFLVSQATRRVAPMGIEGVAAMGPFWSRRFYETAMEHSDQTVLMAYNTALPFSKLYCAYTAHQTKLLLNWASAFDGHAVIIGIPSYEGVFPLSNPRVENVPNASSGVRAALEEVSDVPVTCPR